MEFTALILFILSLISFVYYRATEVGFALLILGWIIYFVPKTTPERDTSLRKCSTDGFVFVRADLHSPWQLLIEDGNPVICLEK